MRGNRQLDRCRSSEIFPITTGISVAMIQHIEHLAGRTDMSRAAMIRILLAIGLRHYAGPVFEQAIRAITGEQKQEPRDRPRSHPCWDGKHEACSGEFLHGHHDIEMDCECPCHKSEG